MAHCVLFLCAGESLMQKVLQDLRFALRRMRRSTWFAATVIGTLALSIGITASIFSVLYAMLIRPLPYQHPERIVSVEPHQIQGYTQWAGYPEYVDWRKLSHSFSALAGFLPEGSVNFESPSGPIALKAVKGTDNFFDVFGVRPILGRTFAQGEDQPGKDDVVVLSYEVWQQSFGGDHAVVGQQAKIDGLSYTIIGVMPAGFRFPIGKINAVYIPLHLTKDMRENRGIHWLQTIARLKPGVTAQQAQAELTSVMTDLGRSDQSNSGRTVRLVGLESYVVGNTESSLHLLLYAVLALLAIGCVNIAGLLLAHGVKREREVALRSAVGALRGRIVRQMLTEAMLLAFCGTVGGIALAYGLLNAIRLLLISSLSRGAEIELNVPVLLASLFVAVLITILAALAPALRLSGVAPILTLRSGGSAGTSRGQHRIRAWFVITQVALALTLLVVAGLLMHMLGSLRDTDLGFSPEHILTTEVDLPTAKYEGRDVVAEFYHPLMDKIRALPGVQAVGMISMLPIQDWGNNRENLHIVGTPVRPRSAGLTAEVRLVTPQYYQVFEDRLVSGRLFDDGIDTPSSGLTTVVNEEFVKRFIPAGRDPIGMQIGDEGNVSAANPRTTIVGAVKNIRQSIYQAPMPQMDYSAGQFAALGSMHLVLRTDLRPESIVPELQRVFHDFDPALPLRTPETMRSVLSDVLIFERLENWLFGAFAALAVLLAVVGLYGLISHEVEMSTRDIGVRVALGATRLRIVSGIYQRVGMMLCLGGISGLILTAAARKYISSVVPMQMEKDAGRILLLTVALIAAGLLAACLPALRASSIEPIDALRDE
jgi:putative ABC transport system permease protein